MELEEISIHPLFTGLTRPPMKFGVTIVYLFILGTVSLIVFIATISFTMLFATVLFGYLFGYLCCMKDPRIFDILLGKAKFTQYANKGYWHCKSYEPF